MHDREALIKLVAEKHLRRYDEEFDASYLSWQDFRDTATEDVDTVLAALSPAPGPDDGAVALARWLVSLDDPIGTPGGEERRRVTLTRIIERAKDVLSPAPAPEVSTVDLAGILTLAADLGTESWQEMAEHLSRRYEIRERPEAERVVSPAPGDEPRREPARTWKTLHVTATRDIPEGHTDQRVRYEYQGQSWEGWLIGTGQVDGVDEAYIMRDTGERWVVMPKNVTPIERSASVAQEGGDRG